MSRSFTLRMLTVTELLQNTKTGADTDIAEERTPLKRKKNQYFLI